MTLTVGAGDLDVAYESWGEGDQVVLMLHGFPDDATAWDGVAAALPTGIRAIAPYARGIGKTKFLSDETVRTGQLAAKVADVVAFLDALNLRQVVVVGHDWGQRTGQALAAMHPDRVIHLISLGGYALTLDRTAKPSLRQLWAFRFHLLANTRLAEFVLRHRLRWLVTTLWKEWSPRKKWRQQEIDAVLPSFENEDFLPLVLDTYRQFSKRAKRDPRFAVDENALAAGLQISPPTSVVLARFDGLDLYDPDRSLSDQFCDVRDVVTLETGHWPNRECPEAIAQIIIAAFLSAGSGSESWSGAD